MNVWGCPAKMPSWVLVRLGTAVAGIYTRGPALLAMNGATLASLAPGRFVLGIGVSSPVVVTDWAAEGRFSKSSLLTQTNVRSGHQESLEQVSPGMIRRSMLLSTLLPVRWP